MSIRNCQTMLSGQLFVIMNGQKRRSDHIMKLVPKPKTVMKDNIALHNKSGKSSLEKRIPKGEVWVREDWHNDPNKKKRLNVHEGVELNLMGKGLSYTKAHGIANKFERNRFK
jgi:hypothetical protein